MSLLLSQLGGGTNWTQSLSDTVTLSDATVKSVGSNKSDTVTLSEAIAKATGKPQSDAITLSEALIKAIGKPVTDSVTLSDTATPTLTPGGGSSWTLSLSDSVTLSEAILKAFNLSKSDTLTLSEDLIKSISKPQSDAVTLSDSTIKSIGVFESDSITLSDLFTSSAPSGTSPVFSLSLNQLTPEEVRRREIRQFIRSGVEAITPSLEFNEGIVSDFAAQRSNDYPATLLVLEENQTSIEHSAPIDSWRIKIAIFQIDKLDSVPEQYEDLVDACDEIAQKLIYKYRNTIEGYKKSRITDLSRKKFVKSPTYGPDCLTGIELSFTLISPDQTNVC